jgi:hypothetical protein
MLIVEKMYYFVGQGLKVLGRNMTQGSDSI